MAIQRLIPNLFVILVLSSCLCYISPVFGEQIANCSYNTWSWDTINKRSVNHRRVVKNYADISNIEKDKYSNCTVCEEDQAWIKIKGIKKVRVCKIYKDVFEKALKNIQKSGFKLIKVTGYRVGKSKGPIDKKGLRTQFSNHSFGSAIDVNRSRNGLYKNCFTFSEKCQLALGGKWDPKRPGTITKDSVVVKEFKAINWKWGGEIKGRQKDFMHFSISGY